MKYVTLFAFALACSSTWAEAQVTTYTSSADFLVANPDVTLIENFEEAPPAIWDITLPNYTSPTGEISFTPISAYPFAPNVGIAPAGSTYDFVSDLAPTASAVLAVTGNEDFVGTLASPVQALGFDVYLNDWPLTLSFFNGDTLLTTLTFDSPPEAGNNIAFAGVSSTDGVTSFRWTATNGQYWNTAIDNIYAGPVGVPEPATWAMMLLGFALVSLVLRKRSINWPPSGIEALNSA
jgi:hypothetical protein